MPIWIQSLLVVCHLVLVVAVAAAAAVIIVVVGVEQRTRIIVHKMLYATVWILLWSMETSAGTVLVGCKIFTVAAAAAAAATTATTTVIMMMMDCKSH